MYLRVPAQPWKSKGNICGCDISKKYARNCISRLVALFPSPPTASPSTGRLDGTGSSIRCWMDDGRVRVS